MMVQVCFRLTLLISMFAIKYVVWSWVNSFHKTCLLVCWSFLLTRLVGGGVLARGCVQEEIRFVICPELIAARLFTEVLDSTEALLVVGEEYSKIYTDLKDVYVWLQQVQCRYFTFVDLNAPISTMRGASNVNWNSNCEILFSVFLISYRSGRYEL